MDLIFTAALEVDCVIPSSQRRKWTQNMCAHIASKWLVCVSAEICVTLHLCRQKPCKPWQGWTLVFWAGDFY